MARKKKSMTVASNEMIGVDFAAQLAQEAAKDDKSLVAAAQRDVERIRMMRNVVQPYVELEFAQNPELITAVACVAQYWNDQGTDETHCDIAYSTNAWPALETIEYGRGEWDKKRKIEVWNGRDYYLGISPYSYYVGGKQQYDYLQEWPGHGAAIPLFACFCKEGSQDNDFSDNYSPYAVFRRAPDGLSLEIVGTMQRPWLDGVKPERDEDNE